MRVQLARGIGAIFAVLAIAGLAGLPATAEAQSLPPSSTAAALPGAVAPTATTPKANSGVHSDMSDGAPQTTGSLPKNAATMPASPAAATSATQQPAPPNVMPKPQTAAPSLPTPPSSSQSTLLTPAGAPGQEGSSTPAAPPRPAAALVPSLADRLHSALDAVVAATDRDHEGVESKRLRVAIAAFYQARNYAPLWITDGKPDAAAQAVLIRLAHAGDDGLSLAGLPIPVFGQNGQAPDLNALAMAEINLTMQVVTYARQASGSRIDPGRIDALIGSKPVIPDIAQILGPVAAAGADAGRVLEDFNPPQAAYKALRAKLLVLRREVQPAAQVIPPGKVLHIGMRDARVPLIRSRFGLGAAAASEQSLLYDTQIAAAVAEFQKASGLPASGALTGRTLAALSGERPGRLEDELLANMEMWRWMPRDMGKDRIEVDIPDFSVSVYRDDQLVWHNKVIVGKPQTPTPVFSNVMRFLIVNPVWNVPASIVRKEMLPHLAQDPNYLARMGFETFVRHGRLVVRQPPGPRNALGRIKFMFPNDYAVYLHDTPSRHLFADARRAFSHGCVRVNEPFGFAEAVLGPKSGWSQARIEHLVGGEQRYINLPEPLPIHLEYFTAFVDANGHLQLRNDLYSYAHKVESALGL